MSKLGTKERIAGWFARRFGRWMLACAIAGTVPLTLWGGGCGKRPVVEPPPQIDAGGIDRNEQIDAPYGGLDANPTDQATGDAPYGLDAFQDAVVPTDAGAACCSATSTSACSPDGTALLVCLQVLGSCTSGSTYGWTWTVQGCPNGCAPGTGGDGGNNAGNDGGDANARCRSTGDAAHDLAPVQDTAGDSAPTD